MSPPVIKKRRGGKKVRARRLRAIARRNEATQNPIPRPDISEIPADPPVTPIEQIDEALDPQQLFIESRLPYSYETLLQLFGPLYTHILTSSEPPPSTVTIEEVYETHTHSYNLDVEVICISDSDE